jgi:hypothetical protein
VPFSIPRAPRLPPELYCSALASLGASCSDTCRRRNGSCNGSCNGSYNGSYNGSCNGSYSYSCSCSYSYSCSCSYSYNYSCSYSYNCSYSYSCGWSDSLLPRPPAWSTVRRWHCESRLPLHPDPSEHCCRCSNRSSQSLPQVGEARKGSSSIWGLIAGRRKLGLTPYHPGRPERERSGR